MSEFELRSGAQKNKKLVIKRDSQRFSVGLKKTLNSRLINALPLNFTLAAVSVSLCVSPQASFGPQQCVRISIGSAEAPAAGHQIAVVVGCGGGGSGDEHQQWPS